MTQDQAAQALIQSFQQAKNVNQSITQQQSQLTTIATARAKAEADYLAASGGADEAFVFNGHIVAIVKGIATVTPPQPIRTPITLK